MADNKNDKDIFESIKKMVETDENSSVLELTDMIGDDGKIVKISKSSLDDQQGETDVTTFLKLMQTNNKDLGGLLPEHLRKEVMAHEYAESQNNVSLQDSSQQDVQPNVDERMDKQNNIVKREDSLEQLTAKAIDVPTRQTTKQNPSAISNTDGIKHNDVILEKDPNIVKQILRSNIVKRENYNKNLEVKMTENTISNLTKHFDDATNFDGTSDYVKKIVQSYVKSYLDDVLPDLVRNTVEEEVKKMLKNMA